MKKAGYGPGFGSIKEAQDYEKLLAKLITKNTAMQNSTNPETMKVVEMAKKEMAKVRFYQRLSSLSLKRKLVAFWCTSGFIK